MSQNGTPSNEPTIPFPPADRPEPNPVEDQASEPNGQPVSEPAAAASRASRPQPLPVHHVGIAVASIDEALRFYRDSLGLPVVDDRVLEDRQLRVVFLRAGNTLLELLAATDPDTTVARFVERRGPGMHHLCFGTVDIDEHLRELADRGLNLIDPVSRPGAHGNVAFIHPDSAHGVLVELIDQDTALEMV